MRTSMAVRRAIGSVCAGVVLLIAPLSGRPIAAQGFGYAAVSISPSSLKCSEEKGTTTQASVESAALQYCRAMGPSDCKVYGVTNACVAVATQPNPAPNRFGVGSGFTREAAAAAALAACAKAGGLNCVVQFSPCGSDDPRWSGAPLPLPPGGKPGSVDPALVGLWKLNVPNGIWVWRISANGTYECHSEAPDNARAHNGMFTASNGKYTLHAIMMSWDDQGTYTMEGAAAVSMTGKLGTGTWYRIESDPDYAAQGSMPAPGITIRR
jgi:hypothetical protein